MRAAVFHGRGDVRVEDVPAPGAPGPGELLLDIELGSICGTDAAEWLHGPLLVPLDSRGPTVLGHEFLGRVAALGPGAEGFAVGDRVVSGAGVSCGSCERCREGRTNLCDDYYTLGLHADGGLAEQVLAPASTCAVVPEGCGNRKAVLAQPLAVALHALRRVGAVEGDRVAVIGVGGIGAFLVGAAVARGAETVAVDVDPVRLELARRLGAREAIEPLLLAHASVDIAIEATGTEPGLAGALAAVRPGGRVLLVGLHDEPRRVNLLDLTLREVDIATTLAHVCASDLPEALHILATTELAAQMIESVVPLERVVEDGIQRLAERRAHGKILVAVSA